MVASAALAALLVLGAIGPWNAAADAQDAETSPEAFVAVGKVSLRGPENPLTSGVYENTGWLILSPTTRRLYQFTGQNPVVVQSFDLDGFQDTGFDLDDYMDWYRDEEGNIDHDRDLERFRDENGDYDLGRLHKEVDLDPATDSLAALKRFEIGGFLLLGGSGGKNTSYPGSQGDFVHAVDESGGRVFIPLHQSETLGQPEGSTGADGQRFFNAGLLEIDGRALDDWDPDAPGSSIADFSTLHQVPGGMQNLSRHALLGMTYVDQGPNGTLVMLMASPSVVLNKPGDHYLLQWDLATGSIESLLLEACASDGLRNSTKVGFYALQILHTPDAIYFGCQAGGSTALAVRVNLTETGAFDRLQPPQTFPLGRGHTDVLVDPAGLRLYFRGITGGESWWVFDAKTDRWVGIIGALVHDVTRPAAGLDPVSGRFYALVVHHVWQRGADLRWHPAPGGFGYSDGRLPSVPQLRHDRDLAYPGLYRIWVDPQTNDRPRRVLVRLGRPTQPRMVSNPAKDPDDAGALDRDVPMRHSYLILEDRAPVASPPEPDDPDAPTIDWDEDPRLTQAVIDGQGGGFGARLLMIGGREAATYWQPRVTGLDTSTTQCVGPDDRDLVIGLVERATLSQDGSTASAMGLSADAITRREAEEPVRSCRPPREQLEPASAAEPIDGVIGEAWNPDDYRAECVGTADDQVTRDRSGGRFSASVGCDAGEQDTQAHAEGAFGGQSPVGIASSYSDSNVYRDPERGLVARVRSEARGIEVAGLGSIGMVRAEMETWAAGKQGTAGSSFNRTACGVFLAGVEHPGCASGEQLVQLSEGVSRALGTRGDLRARAPDEELASGTPGGYRAEIRRDRKDELQDQAISRDFSMAVPALELIRYNDHYSEGTGRTILQLAAVEGFSNYAVQCLFGQTSSGCAEPPDGPPPPGPGPAHQSSTGLPSPLEGGQPGAGSEPQFIDQLIPASQHLASGAGEEGWLRRVVTSPGQALWWMLRNPGEALLVAAMWTLLLTPLWLSWRRRAIGRIGAAL